MNIKKQFFICFILISCISNLCLSQTAKDLSVDIKNIGSSKGYIMIGIYDSATNFLTENRIKSLMVPVSNVGTMTIQIEDLKYGSYAISIFHDENANKKLDKNFIGIPKESYAFSNKAKARFGPPKYETAKFVFDQTTKNIELILN